MKEFEENTADVTNFEVTVKDVGLLVPASLTTCYETQEGSTQAVQPDPPPDEETTATVCEDDGPHDNKGVPFSVTVSPTNSFEDDAQEGSAQAVQPDPPPDEETTTTVHKDDGPSGNTGVLFFCACVDNPF